MEYLWLLMLAAAVVVGLGAAARGRSGPRRDDDLLRALGFAPAGAGVMQAPWQGRLLSVRRERRAEGSEVQRLSLALAPSPLPYEVLARALGRGEVLAALHELTARADEARLEAELAPRLSARRMRRHIDRVFALALALEALPRAEGMARWFLELTGGDRGAALQRLIEAFPDAPETLAACRVERDLAHDPQSAALARQHIARRAS